MKTVAAALAALVVGLSGCARKGAPEGAAAGPRPSGGAGGTGDIELLDPAGDDAGPGNYRYPADAAFEPGSLDLIRFEVKDLGDSLELTVSVAARIEDPWHSQSWGGNGFSVQLAFVFIDLDHRKGSGAQQGLPGLNVRFAPDEAWDRVVVVSPYEPERVRMAIARDAPQWTDRIVVPQVTRAAGKGIVAVVKKAQLAGTPPTRWGYQVCIQPNLGFPATADQLTRNLGEGQGAAAPQVVDILVPPAKGGPDEAKKQREVLGKYRAAAEPTPRDFPVVPMVYPAS